MNIWLTGDLHFNTTQFKYLLAQQDKYDVLCLAGDLLNIKVGSFTEQTQWISNFLEKFTKPILCCSGNHDLDSNNNFHWLDNCSKVNLYLDNRKPKINGVRFGVMPYLDVNYSRFYDCEILLTHVPPKHTLTAQEGDTDNFTDWGDEELYEMLKHRILSPKYLLCGHVERPLQTTDTIGKTKIINPGANHINDKPCVYEIQM